MVACEGDDGSPDDGTPDDGSMQSLVGVWELVSIDGQPLPTIVDEYESTTWIVRQGAVLLDADSSFMEATEVWRVESVDTSDVHWSMTGRWSRDGDAVRLAVPPLSGVGDSLILFWYYESDRLLNDETNEGERVYERSDP